ncbi:aminoglycoside phosphotransferase [Kushneria pakistanensis]|uniref:Aminoglycoside phosphotransferase n=1 Tax=Kushneria pakistanensis TaxID=1508770 RepID=A0ABQ3FBA1_9GAMM|nr:phosphotransferase [Kushneria pakistanensis]GHC16411.1 aminoglycoside phosphotransferase [Kushneria pakistanensis]
MTARLDALRHWAASHHGLEARPPELEIVTDDASFRRYFRLHLGNANSRILMDAPPERENSQAFVDIARQWRSHGIQVPELYHVDLDQGFIEMQDLGDDMLRQHLAREDQRETLMMQAISTSVTIAALPVDTLPAYDDRWLTDELELFPQWCLTRWLDIATPESWPQVRDQLVAALTAQPQVCVHRDFHAQNLMCHDEQLWVIDFQGAVHGPLAYDLVSLLRDRNNAWFESDQARWIEAWRQKAQAAGIITSVGLEAFRRMVDLTGAQRSLKVLGLFCRLALRDDKPRYLTLLPLFVEHVRQGLTAQPGFEAFMQWFDTCFVPELDARLIQYRTDRHES